MSPRFETPVRPSTIVLTPPTGFRTASSRPYRKRRRASFAGALDVIRGEPTAIHYLVAATIYSITPWLVAQLQTTPLPHDGILAATVYLAAGASRESSRPEALLLTIAVWVNVVGAAALFASAMLPPVRRAAGVHAVAARFYKYAIALPVWTLLVVNLDRFIANEVQSLTGLAWWDATRLFAAIEGRSIAWMQDAIASPALTAFASFFDATVRLLPVALGGALLVAADRGRVLNSLIIVYLLAALLAVPLFVLVSAFEPWTTNAAYGADLLATNIRYLYADAPASTLTRINTHYHWAAGGVFPSLNVAVLTCGALVLRRHHLRSMSVVLFAWAAMSALVAVYLGRHWLIDSLAAIPFALSVVALGKRFPLDVNLTVRSPKQLQLRPGEIAVVDPNEQSADWLLSGYYTRQLSMLSRAARRSMRLAAQRAHLAFARLVSSRSKRQQRRRRHHYSAPAESNRRVRFSGYRTPNGATPVVGDVGSRDPAARTPI